MVVRDLMTAEVITVRPETRVPEIARLLRAHRVSAVPVVSPDRRVLGVVSEGDVMRKSRKGTERRHSWRLALLASRDELARDYVLAHGKQPADVLSRPVISVTVETTLGTLARLFEEHYIKRAPVARTSSGSSRR